EVLEEVPNVRKDLGNPPLVTPSSQIVGTQAVFNVIFGERYKMITKETKDILLGRYGQTTNPVDKALQDRVVEETGEQPITHRFADDIAPELDTLRKEIAPYMQQDEDVLSYALFPQVAMDFFKYRKAQQDKVDLAKADTANGAYPA
nr:oxaloacetate decarboxylase subunit alpha [Lachnospiraceae bacterium]